MSAEVPLSPLGRGGFAAPPGFVFAVKASRFCTNRRVLGEAGESVQRFVTQGLVELKDRLGLVAVPDEERGRYHTLSGLMMLLTGRLPKEGDQVDWEHWRFEIVDMDGRRIDKVLVRRLESAGENDPTG